MAVSVARAQRMSQARARRAGRMETKIQWFEQQMARGMKMGMKQRVKLAAMLLREKVVHNISIPVVKKKAGGGFDRRDMQLAGGQQGFTRRTKKGRFKKAVQVVERSNPGEFPRADTTRLMKDIQYEVEEQGKNIVGRVSTSLDYGAILETTRWLDRAFLLPSFLAMRQTITRIITSPSPPFPGGSQ